MSTSAHESIQAAKNDPRADHESASSTPCPSAAALSGRKRNTESSSSSNSQDALELTQNPSSSIAEQLDVPSIVRSDGFVQRIIQRVLEPKFKMLSKRSEQNRINFRVACRLSRIMDFIFENIKRPVSTLPDTIYAERYLPDGDFSIADETARFFGKKCYQASRQCAHLTLSVETLVGFARVLRPIMLPVVEAYWSGELKLYSPPTAEKQGATVVSIPREERANLSVAFFNTLVLLMKDELTTGSLCDLLLVIDLAIRPTKARKYSFVEREDLLNANQPFDREDISWWLDEYVDKFEAGFLETGFLWVIMSGLNTRLSGFLKKDSSFLNRRSLLFT